MRITTNSTCPNCNYKRAFKKTHSNGDVLIVCQSCGLRLTAETNIVVTNSYIDHARIGEDINIFDPNIFNSEKNNDVIEKGSILIDDQIHM